MSKPGTSESRKFELATEIGAIKGLLEGLTVLSKKHLPATAEQVNAAFEAIANIDIPHVANMTAKNTLQFSGHVDANPEELIANLKNLKVANDWTEAQLFAQAVYTLCSDAKRWYQSQPDNAFDVPVGADPGVTKFGLFSRAFIEKFKSDTAPGDMISDVLDHKQKKGESVDDYISSVLKMFDLGPQLSESLKCSLLISGFRPEIQDALRLKDLNTIVLVQKWARKIERMSFATKSKSVFVSSADHDDRSDVNLVDKPIIHQQPVRRPQHNRPNNPPMNKSKRGPCFYCQGPHIQKFCPQLQQVNPPIPYYPTTRR